MSNSKKIYLILIIGFFLSISYSVFTLSEFDKYDKKNNRHLMIGGDLNLIWKEAEAFKKDFFENKKDFFYSGIEYTRTYLPSKIIATYSQLFKYELFDNFNKNRVKEGGKLLYLLFQSSIFYISLLYFYQKLKIFLNNENLSIYTISFLALEPTILQWHSTFWTESIYFTFQILFLAILIEIKSTYLKFIKLGIILGLMYYQKTVSIFLIFPLVAYLLIIKLDKKLLNILIVLITYTLFLFFLGFNNYKKTSIFYILPLQTKDAHYIHLVPNIYNKSNHDIEYSEYKIKKEETWKNLNNYNENNFQDLYNFKKFRQSLAIEEILNNKLITIKIYINKILHHFLLNPVQTYYWHEYNKNDYQVEYHLSEDKKKWVPIRIIYSILIFSIILLGFLKIVNTSNNIKFYGFILITVAYYSLMLGWLGNTRYFMPSMVLLSFFFGMGMHVIEEKYKKYKNI